MLGVKLQVTLAAVCTLAHARTHLQWIRPWAVCAAIKLRYLLYPHENM